MEHFESRMSALARTVFRVDIGLDTLRKDEPAWDSWNHLKLAMAFEMEFNVRIPVDRIEGIQTLREYGEFL